MRKKKWCLRDFYIPLIPVPFSLPFALLVQNGFDFLFFLSSGAFLFVYLPLLIVLTDKVNKR